MLNWLILNFMIMTFKINRLYIHSFPQEGAILRYKNSLNFTTFLFILLNMTDALHVKLISKYFKFQS